MLTMTEETELSQSPSHLNSFLSSKPFPAFKYRDYKNSRRNLSALNNGKKKRQKELQKPTPRSDSPRNAATPRSSKMTCRRMKESSTKEFKEQNAIGLGE